MVRIHSHQRMRPPLLVASGAGACAGAGARDCAGARISVCAWSAVARGGVFATAAG
jgi:hypothetical protein